MLSLTRLRKIDPILTNNLTDEELEKVRTELYEWGQLIFEDWLGQKTGSKYPVGLFSKNTHGLIMSSCYQKQYQNLKKE